MTKLEGEAVIEELRKILLLAKNKGDWKAVAALNVAMLAVDQWSNFVRCEASDVSFVKDTVHEN